MLPGSALLARRDVSCYALSVTGSERSSAPASAAASNTSEELLHVFLYTSLPRLNKPISSDLSSAGICSQPLIAAAALPCRSCSRSRASQERSAQPGDALLLRPPTRAGDDFMCLTHDTPVYTSWYDVCFLCNRMTLCTQPRHNPDCFPWKESLV